MNILVHWLLNAAIILGVAQFVPGIRVRDFTTAMVVALVLGVLTTLLYTPLTWIGTAFVTVLALPAVILSFGLLVFVIHFLVQLLVMLLLLRMTASLVSGFAIYNAAALAVGAVLISFLQSLASTLLLP